MSEQPAQGAVGTPGGPGQGSSAVPGAQNPDHVQVPSQPGGPGDREPGVSDFGQFDWFADPASFGLRSPDGVSPDQGVPEQGQGRSSWWPPRRRRAGSAGAASGAGGPDAQADGRAPGRRRPPWWLLGAGLVALALGCTALGGVVGGVVAANSAASQNDATYSIGSVPHAGPGKPSGPVAAIAAKDTPGVVMIKVNNGQGTGSGFVIKGGYIITDNHVVTVDGMVRNPSLRIYFADGRSAAGQVVGRDPYSDIAVIRAVGVTGLPALPLGNSAAIAVGDPVVAIGSPLGLADTVTSGIVSALDRPVQPAAASGTAPQVFFDAIQTDAPINPGNSGGPLVNAHGQVVGIDAAIDTLGDDPITGTQGGSIGLGFAIPINQARRVIVQLVQTGHATHSVLGASLNQAYAGNGAQITSVAVGKGQPAGTVSPAARAGLRPGDVVTWAGKQPITTAYSLLDAVRSRPPGSRIAITYLRRGQTRRAELTLGSATS